MGAVVSQNSATLRQPIHCRERRPAQEPVA